MKRISTLLILVAVLFVSSYGQDPQQPVKKKSVTFDMNDAKPVPREEPKKESKPATPTTPTVPVSPTAPTQPTQPAQPVDPRANWPDWARVQADFLTAYFEGQLNGDTAAPYFYYSRPSQNDPPGTFPVSMAGSTGYKLIRFDGDAEQSVWRVSVEAPPASYGRHTSAGIWFAVIKYKDDSYKIYSLSRINPYAN